MSVEIEHEFGASRFSAKVDGVACELDYRLAGQVMTITHTGVPAEVGGRGIAGQLVRTALEAAKQQGWKVVPACSYAEKFMEKHPEYDSLRA